MKKLGLLATVIAALAYSAAPAFADEFDVAINLAKPTEDLLSVKSTDIEFTSNFVGEIDLTGGMNVTGVWIPFSWQTVPAGESEFVGVEKKKDGFTKGVEGVLLDEGKVAEFGVSAQCPDLPPGLGIDPPPGDLPGIFQNTVCVPVLLTKLRCSKSKSTGRGKVHLKVTLKVKNVTIGLGVNLKVSDPGFCT